MKNPLPTSLILVGWLLASCVPLAASGSTPSAPVPVVSAVPVTVVVRGGTASPLTPVASPKPPTPVPSLVAGLSLNELKYRLLDQYPNFFFCDPDYYPIARSDETGLALQRFAELQANTEEFQAILNHDGLAGLTSFTDDQKLLLYRDHKKLAAIDFVLAGDSYQFQLRTAGEPKPGTLITGLIDGSGRIIVQSQTPTFATCPICLAVHTLIDTPRGAVFVEDLLLGELVWTQEAGGRRVAAPIMQLVRVPVPLEHVMVHLVLNDGRELWASPGHPTTDRRRLGDLTAGDPLDGSRVTLAQRVPYGQPATYDLLPAGPTGSYWADGILLGSTLSTAP